jgi:peptidoglycan/LPS O-acetylase OafA/YrhL
MSFAHGRPRAGVRLDGIGMTASLKPPDRFPHGADALPDGAAPDLVTLRTFHLLDALRGVAAVTIVLFHTSFVYRLPTPAEGQIAVDLFFVMSGFIIAYRYEDELKDGMGLWRFVKLRLIRLYPLFILGSVLGAVPAALAIVTGHDDDLHLSLLQSFPLAVAMLPSPFALPHISYLYPLNYVAWSLALEVAINIVYAATVNFWTLPRLLCVAGFAFLALCVCAVRYGTLRYGYDWAQAEVGPLRIAYGFTLGLLICRIFKRSGWRPAAPWWLMPLAALAVFFFLPPGGRALWELVAVTVLVPLLVVFAVANEPPTFLRRACAFAGASSYVIYSMHAPFAGFFLRGEGRLHVDLYTQTFLESCAFTVLLALLCLAAHFLFDVPLRRWLTRRLLARRCNWWSVGKN